MSNKNASEPNYEGFALALLEDARDSKSYWENWRDNRMTAQPRHCLSRMDAELVLRYARIHRLIDGEEEEMKGIMGKGVGR